MMPWRPLLFGAVLLWGLAPKAFAQHSIAYLYIEANTGTSSGGHVGIKLDDSVYHFQNKNGLLRLERDDWDRFQHLYSDLDNRDIHLAYLAIPDHDIEAIREHLAHQLLIQNARLERLASKSRDLALLQALRDGTPFTIPGGRFFTERPAKPVSLASAPQADFGIQASASRLESMTRQRFDLRYPISEFKPVDSTHLAVPQGFADRWIDLRQNEIALEVILGKKALDPSMTLHAGPLSGINAPHACSGVSWLERYENKLENDAKQLIERAYPGSGLILLRTLARLSAVRLSLSRNELILLSPASVLSQPPDTRETFFRTGQSRLEEDLQQRLRLLSQETFCSTLADDQAYYHLERVTLDLFQTTKANAAERAVAFDSEVDLPSGIGPVSVTVQRENPWIPSDKNIQDAETTREMLSNATLEEMRYGLITRNCVTELVRSVNSAFPGETEPSSFGGHINPIGSQAFIPFRFFELVKGRYPVTRTETILSFRHRALTKLGVADQDPWSSLREGNTLTTTLYTHRSEDGLFLFFTDDETPFRPLLGLVNLSIGMTGTAIGLITLPWDQGALLESGAKGSLFSLPEIAYWNIRKGSYSESTVRETVTPDPP